MTASATHSAIDAVWRIESAKVMKDKRLAKMMDPKNMPFDGKRMFWGGFKVMVDA